MTAKYGAYTGGMARQLETSYAAASVVITNLSALHSERSC